MAQLLHHQDSAFYGKEIPGRRWSIFQFFGLSRRLRSVKMLSEKKHGQDKSPGGSKRRSYVTLKDEDSGVMDDSKNAEVKGKQKGSKKNSGKSSLKSLIAKKLYGKEGEKEKMLPVAPKLLRTLSMHYLERNEYVLDGEAATNGNGSSHGAKMLLQQALSNTLEGSDTDKSSSLLLNRGDEHAKQKSHRSISMDGILHKVPYGHKVSGNKIGEELPRSASVTYDRDGLKPYIGRASKRHVNQGFQRSRSLSESLESYSLLLDSISSSEAKRVLTSSKSTRDHSLDGPGANAFHRTSSSQFRSKGLTTLAEHLVMKVDASESHVADKTVGDGDVNFAVDESSCNQFSDGSKNPVLLEEYLHDKSFHVEVSTEADLCIAPLPSEEHAATCDDDQAPSSTKEVLYTDPPPLEQADIPEEPSMTCDDDQAPSSTKEDLYTDPPPLPLEQVHIPEEPAMTCDDDQAPSSTKEYLYTDPPPLEEDDISEGPSITFDDDQTHSSTEADSSTALPSEDINTEEEHARTSDDTKFQSCTALPSEEINLAEEDEITSYVSKSVEDSSLMPGNDTGDSVDSNVVIASTCEKPSATSLTQEILQEHNSDDLNGLQVDPKNEAELNYVNDIFNKSSFTNETLFDGWCSQNTVALQEEDCQHYEAAAVPLDFTDMCADELLLFDMTNEALLDIYKSYSASKSKASRFSSFERPKPVGDQALRELQSRMSCHLDRPGGTEISAIVFNDLAKADRWINLQRDVDHVGNKLADSVLDKLLTELTLQLAKF
ncbi:uncharacterized protein LOC100846589 isoform X2 [Brachypodium distachyon]|uniref:DUF4378 domain-containing protein n=1 Tax=Brachypodium distachyon TaxID=15368 RepID=A0A0Q3QMM5_BRADI|nr:uncharacterized protein LOC100846589 isoform X2 [Brachypodium distachyon]KQK02722.1 hypothetical protein BRADI_2g03290v3 [Brachypodium distachyon]KQK02723.1 hypothetical protein BRADI_2g03290v3 [Brachypodium distachyon]PNT69938.1 hypothetical protein BRADI_2g03290v3 [Brachypodium distachyon]PNT69940.1 hypothetical protein BRADI_2g03290v3 [Brachypodium distachyon]|eukprot:XP_010230462.1 uncharacterized protein LOC100846589 isoform X2 [Brachypodium distachyon]